MSLLNSRGELILYGDVGDGWWGDFFTAVEVEAAISEHESNNGKTAPLKVRINSGGGFTDEGIAIYNSLRQFEGKITIVIDGVAASAASIIAMAGDALPGMNLGAQLMIHEAWTWVTGNATDLRKVAEDLDKTCESMAEIYAEAAGIAVEKAREIMRASPWLTVSESVELGFAVAIDQSQAKAFACCDYREYPNAPEQLKTLAAKNNWHRKPRKNSASANADGRKPELNLAHQSQQSEESEMTEEEIAAMKEAAKAEGAKAAMASYQAKREKVFASDEAKGRETLAEHLLKQDDDADAIIATLAAAPKAPPKDGQGDDEQANNGGTNAQAYDADRQSASDLSQPSGGGDGKETSGLSKLVSAHVKRVKSK